VKAQIGASGIGLIKVPAIDSGDPLPEIGNHFFYEGAAMVQGWLEPGVLGVARIFSPSVQMFLDDSSVHLFDVTEQILSSDSIHEGNESPAPLLKTRPEVGDELLRQASVAGEWLHSVGYRGTASTDFLVVERDDGELEAYVCEINARVTGATYPAVLARHFRPQSAWLLRNIRLHESLAGDRMLELLDNSKQLYERGDAAGLLPINFNLGRDELVFKGQFLCLAETLDECHQILGDTASVLPIAWEYERD
jgi:hypothetical protein